MKKFIAVAMTFAVILSLCTGCGSQTQPVDKAPNPEMTAPVEETPAMNETSFDEVSWPTRGLFDLLPAIDWSDHGQIVYEGDDGLIFCVAQTTKDDFDNYSDAAYDAGFNIDHWSSFSMFDADNEDGMSLTLLYIDQSPELLEQYKGVYGLNISEGNVMIVYMWDFSTSSDID